MKQTEQTLDKMEWCKPALVVLVRLKPEESVLTGCKIGDWSFIGFGEFWMRCQVNACQNCMTFVSS